MQQFTRHITNTYLNLRVYTTLSLLNIMSEPTIAEIAKKLEDYIHESEGNFDTVNRVLFGDKYTGEKGMKEKVDDIHQRITQG